MKNRKIWTATLGCIVLSEVFLGAGNSDIFAKPIQKTYLLQQSQVTGAAVTVTESAVVTNEGMMEVSETAATESSVNTQPESVPPSLDNTVVVVSDQQVTTAIAASLKKKSLQLGVSEQVKMPVQNKSGLKVTYQSKNKRVASVSKKGVICGKKQGSTEVYAKISTKTLVLKAQVKKKPTSIKIKVPKRSSVSIGSKISLQASLNKGSASYKIRWASSKKSVATVNTSGVLLVKGRGRTTITARTYNGKKASLIFAFH